MTHFCTPPDHDWIFGPFSTDDDPSFNSMLGRRCCCGKMMIIPSGFGSEPDCPPGIVPSDSATALRYLLIYHRTKTRKRPEKLTDKNPSTESD